LRQAGAAEEVEAALVHVAEQLIAGWTPQHGLVRHNVLVVTALLAPLETASTAAAGCADRTAPTGTAALMAAIEGGSADVVEVLLQAGAAVNATTAARRSPLSVAAEMQQADIVALLLQSGAAVDAVDSKGKTALMWAAASRSVSMMRTLLQAGAAVNAHGANGGNALHTAVMSQPQFGRRPPAAIEVAVQALLEAGADASAAMHNGLTALHYGYHWPASVSKLLLDAGAKLEACVRTYGEHAAVVVCHNEVL
jgi:ankyrin repeat protein